MDISYGRIVRLELTEKLDTIAPTKRPVDKLNGPSSGRENGQTTHAIHLMCTPEMNESSYGVPKGTCRWNILCRAHEIISRAHEIRTRGHDIVSRAHAIVSRAHEIVSRTNSCARLTKSGARDNKSFARLSKSCARVNLTNERSAFLWGR